MYPICKMIIFRYIYHFKFKQLRSSLRISANVDHPWIVRSDIMMIKATTNLVLPSTKLCRRSIHAMWSICLVLACMCARLPCTQIHVFIVPILALCFLCCTRYILWGTKLFTYSIFHGHKLRLLSFLVLYIKISSFWFVCCFYLVLKNCRSELGNLRYI